MAFKSQAQRAKFYELLAQGKMKPETIAKWESETTGRIPARVQPARSARGTVKPIKPKKVK